VYVFAYFSGTYVLSLALLHFLVPRIGETRSEPVATSSTPPQPVSSK